MSAAEHSPVHGGAVGVRCARAVSDIIEIAARRDCAEALREIAGSRGWSLPAFGQSAATPGCIAICVRPERWLLLQPAAAAGAAAADCQSAGADTAAVVDLSSALTVFRLSGADVREMLARGCRLDLDPGIFKPGQAAATIIAQVSVIVVALSSGMLLLTPSTTARHFSEWIAHTATPFGFETAREIAFHEI